MKQPSLKQQWNYNVTEKTIRMINGLVKYWTKVKDAVYCTYLFTFIYRPFKHQPHENTRVKNLSARDPQQRGGVGG